MPSHQQTEKTNGDTRGDASHELAMQFAQQDLTDAGIDPNSPSAGEFLARVDAFGIMGAQPPKVMREETTRCFKPENAIDAKEGDFLGMKACSCGRVHQVLMGKNGPQADTGWY